MRDSMKDLIDMNKKALEAYGRTVGIELDRRETKEQLITQLEEHIMGKKSKKKSGLKHAFDAAKDVVSSASETVSESKVLLRDKSTGVFYEGKKPAGAKGKSGTKGGVPFWEA